MKWRSIEGTRTTRTSTEVDAGTLDDADGDALSKLSGRRAERKQAKHDAGHTTVDIVVHSQRDKVDLVRLYMNGVADSDTVTALRAALAERPADA